jgi:ribulose-5-phosphate 4-epimerase/fuculose-1-phosphate aldolase
MQYQELRTDLAAALRWAARENLHEGVDNHFSVAVPGGDGKVHGDLFLINPYRRHWTHVAASDVVLCDGEGTVVEGKHEVETSAFCIHSRVHMRKPTAAAVLHTHMPYATAIAHVAGGRLQMAGQASLMFDGRIAYDDTYGGLALDSAEGDRMAEALGDADILFLGGHGVLVTGSCMAAALTDLYYLERACMFQVLAHSHGGGLMEVSGEIREHMRSQRAADIHNLRNGFFNEVKRVLAEEEPGYLQ